MSSTSWKTYTDNPEAWNAMLTACTQAKESIDFEIFIFTPDTIGERFIDICAKKAQEGVRVRFLWDAAGSFTFFASSIIEDLKKKGIELRFFKRFFPGVFSMHRYTSWYFRDHHRTLVIDGKIGFTGSTSIETRMESWRDTTVKIEGAVTTHMSAAFELMWARAIGKRLTRKSVEVVPDNEFEYVSNTPISRNRELYRRILEAIRCAEKSIFITVPYFVPNHKLARAIRLSAHRGVDVRILLPAASDFPTVDLGARTFFHQYLKAGICIYLYRGKMLHTKSIVVDGTWSTVGTMNLDHISLHYNYEANLVSHNKKFAQELTNHFYDDIKNADVVTLDLWNRRFFVEKIATILVKLFRVFL